MRTDSPTGSLDPSYRTETQVYPSLPALQRLYTFALVDTLDQRRGDSFAPDALKTFGGWGRVVGYSGATHGGAQSATSGPSFTYSQGFLQTGMDLLLKDWGAGLRTLNGIFVSTGLSSANTSNASNQSTGMAGLTGYSAGVYSTTFASNGMYLDLLGQATRFVNAIARSSDGASTITNGRSVSGSAEGGWRLAFGNGFYIAPQAQAVVDSFQFATSIDAFGRMSYPSKSLLRGRLGLLLGSTLNLDGKENYVTTWVRSSVWNVFGSPATTTFLDSFGRNGVNFSGETGRTWFQADAGLAGNVTRRLRVFANIGYERGIDVNRHAVTGRIGLQFQW